MCDTFEIEVDDSEILLCNGRVDLSAEKWCHTVCELNRARNEIERLREELLIARDSYYSCNRALNMANKRIEELENRIYELEEGVPHV